MQLHTIGCILRQTDVGADHLHHRFCGGATCSVTPRYGRTEGGQFRAGAQEVEEAVTGMRSVVPAPTVEPRVLGEHPRLRGGWRRGEGREDRELREGCGGLMAQIAA